MKKKLKQKKKSLNFEEKGMEQVQASEENIYIFFFF